MIWNPSTGRVLVTLYKEQKKQGGLILPDTAPKNVLTGIVQSVGTEIIDVREGDKVLFSPYVGVKINETDYVLKEEDILAYEKAPSEEGAKPN